jgi:hypothetical protein
VPAVCVARVLSVVRVRAERIERRGPPAEATPTAVTMSPHEGGFVARWTDSTAHPLSARSDPSLGHTGTADGSEVTLKRGLAAVEKLRRDRVLSAIVSGVGSFSGEGEGVCTFSFFEGVLVEATVHGGVAEGDGGEEARGAVVLSGDGPRGEHAIFTRSSGLNDARRLVVVPSTTASRRGGGT